MANNLRAHRATGARALGGRWVALRADDVDLDRDAALVERFQTGDEEAFADLYRRYFGRLRRYCQRRLGDHHDAEEAAQEALVKAYRALPNFGGDRRFYPWLRVIATNVCNDRCKRKAPAAPADPDGGDVVVDSVFDAMDAAFVRAALRDLNPRHRAALSLWAEGRASRDIAEELGCSTGAADVTLHRARQSFRARFLAITGDGKLGALALFPALGRWATRWRNRIATRVGEHTELSSPLLAKVAASAIAVTVVGGAVGSTTSTSRQVQPTAPPSSVVHLQTAPASVTSSAPADASGGTTTRSNSVVSTPAHAPADATPAAAQPSVSDLTPRLMTADEAQAKSKNAPVRVVVPGVVGFAVDPSPAAAVLRPITSGGHS